MHGRQKLNSTAGVNDAWNCHPVNNEHQLRWETNKIKVKANKEKENLSTLFIIWYTELQDRFNPFLIE